MTFLRCFTLATALFLSPLATPHHVVFEEIEEIETAIKQLYSSIKNGHAAWISYSSLDFARDQLRANLQKLIRALQAAPHRRLSIDLLPNDTLRKLLTPRPEKLGRIIISCYFVILPASCKLKHLSGLHSLKFVIRLPWRNGRQFGKYIFSLLGIAIFTTVSVILGYILFTRYYFTLRQRVIDWVMHILPESVRALMPSLSPPEAAA